MTDDDKAIELQRRLINKTKGDKTNLLLKKSKYLYLNFQTCMTQSDQTVSSVHLPPWSSFQVLK